MTRAARRDQVVKMLTQAVAAAARSEDALAVLHTAHALVILEELVEPARLDNLREVLKRMSEEKTGRPNR